MGIVLKVTPEELIRMATDVETQLKTIKNQFDQMNSDISRTRSFCEGEASDTHKSQYDALAPEIQKALSRLEKRPTELLKMADLYKSTESAATEAAMTLSEDVIV